VIIALFLVAMTSCRSSNPVVTVPVETRIEVRERLVEVPMPADSSMMTAYFECDSNYNVLLKSFDEHRSARMATSINLDAGKLSYQVIRVSDTVYLTARDSIVYKEIAFPVNVPVEINRLTGFQHFQIWTGRCLLAIGALFVAYKIIV